jgi:[CysO sulfur-carrier protein]-S-L-cysteine hydrolase
LSTPFRLLLPRPLLDEMVEHARAELPNECVGLLAGRFEDGAGARVGRVERRYPLVNALASPKEYLSDGRSMFTAMKDMGRHDLDVLAFYHSHPTSQPVPSRKDLESNYWPNVVQFIISLMGNEPEVRGWWLTDRDYREAEWDCTG